MLNFNSIKVRLEPFIDEVVDSYAKFQFHKGAIRTSHEAEFEAYQAISIP